jgi:TonB family protein
VIAHVLLAVVVVTVDWAPPPAKPLNLRVTPLVAPREFTQRAAANSKPSLEVNLQGLLSTESVAAPKIASTQPAAVKRVVAPIPSRTLAAAPKPEMEAPKIDDRPRDLDMLARNLPPGIGNPTAAVPPVPPPQIQSEEKPKLAFEKPGGDLGKTANMGAVAGRIPSVQRSTVDDAARQTLRQGGGGLTVGDLGEGIGGLGEALNNPNAPPRNGSSLELLSDPMGADFRPYLIRILSSVRRNWLAVFPESARLGRRGKVLIQFAINRDGSVPKLVIATPSGTEALDRAAVAGVSASNPFPPLPDDFKGPQVRLQFTFLYNIPTR